MRRLLSVVLAAALMSGCGGLSPAGRLKDKTAVLIEAANHRNVSGVIKAAEDLRAEIRAQNQGGKITDHKTTVLLQFLAAIERDAPLLAASPSPSATPSATPSSTPSPSASPTPSPTPSPTASPTPSPTPVVTTAPPTLPPPTVGVGIGGGHPSPSTAL